MSRPHWINCITHFDEEVAGFVASYFGEEHRRCLLVAAAGFDPRSRLIAKMLADILGHRLDAYFIREDRGKPAANLIADADANEAALRKIVPTSQVKHVKVFGDDGAAVGGPGIAALLGETEIDESVTDVVLDMSALSIGIGFPAAKILLADCEAMLDRSFHILVVSNPGLDARIAAEPAETAMPVKGFAGSGHLTGTLVFRL